MNKGCFTLLRYSPVAINAFMATGQKYKKAKGRTLLYGFYDYQGKGAQLFLLFTSHFSLLISHGRQRPYQQRPLGRLDGVDFRLELGEEGEAEVVTGIALEEVGRLFPVQRGLPI